MSDEVNSPPSSLNIPDPVRNFLRNLHRASINGSPVEFSELYDRDWHKYSERFYKQDSWPSPESISSIVDNDYTTLVLYKDLYFRHIYST